MSIFFDFFIFLIVLFVAIDDIFSVCPINRTTLLFLVPYPIRAFFSIRALMFVLATIAADV